MRFLKYNIIVFLILCIVLLAVIIVPVLAEKNISMEKCVLCHGLNESVNSWKGSSHSRISCIKCHGNATLNEMPKHVFKVYKNINTHYSGDSYILKSQEPLSDSVCEQCHTSNRPITPTGDLIIPHEKHKAQNIPCVRCHSYVGHGVSVQLNMTECMQCHETRKVSHDCTVCHANIQVPDSHIGNNWYGRHGLNAYNSVSACARCHAYFDLIEDSKNINNPLIPDLNEFVPNYKATRNYAKGNPYCLNCHSKEPSYHVIGWLIEHPFYTNAKGIRNCLACHHLSDPNNRIQNNQDKMDCNKCHSFLDY